MSGELPIDFDPASLVLMNAIMALMMFGVSLSLTLDDFRRVLREPKAPFAGLIAQFFLLPALTSLGTWWLGIDPEFALGMILVASCPGGAFSNVMTWLARGNVAVSVSMTAVSSLVASVLTPMNFAFYGWLNPNTRPILTDISVDTSGILALITLVLVLPLLLGMTAGAKFPALVARSEKPLRIASVLVFFAFVAIAFSKNLELFVSRFQSFFWLVVLHNAMALTIGSLAGRLMKLPTADRRAVTLEVGIQNSGLALVLLFTFLPQAGSMMLIAAFWGVWHIVSGLSLSFLWSRLDRRAGARDHADPSSGGTP